MGDETELPEDTPKQVRIPTKTEWVPFLAATKAMHPTGRSPRARVLREFIRWYMRRPGAKLPERPPAGAWSKPDTAAQPDA